MCLEDRILSLIDDVTTFFVLEKAHEKLMKKCLVIIEREVPHETLRNWDSSEVIVILLPFSFSMTLAIKFKLTS